MPPTPPRRSSTAAQPSLAIMVANGWRIYAHPLFIDQFEILLDEVEKLRAADQKGYREKKKTKLLAAIVKVAFAVIPDDPADDSFRQGNTLGALYRHWRRAKFFEGRFRLFFRYTSAAKAIVLAWVNDADTLRTYGSKTDAYLVFKRMLDKNRPPDDWEMLLREAKGAASRAQKLLERGKKAK